MTSASRRVLAFVAIAFVIALAAFLALSDDARNRIAAYVDPKSASRFQFTTPPATPDARPNQPGVAGRDGAPGTGAPAKRDEAGRTPVESLPEVLPETRSEASRSDDKPRSDKAEGDGTPTSLDIVRIEPNGDSVIAGRTRPNAAVELLRDNKPIARVTADPSGNFAIVPPTLPTGNSEISYRSIAPDGQETRGKESVAVVIAENRSTKPLVAVSTPDKPTEVLSQPDAPAPNPQSAERAPTPTDAQPSPPPSSRQADAQRAPESGSSKPVPVQIVSIDAQQGGRLDVATKAASGATLRLYLNETMVAAGQAGPDGRLVFTIGRGVRAGSYQVRVDQVEAGTGKVARRAQVAFDFPEAAASPVRQAETPQPAAPSSPKPDKPAIIAKGPDANGPEAEARAPRPDGSADTAKGALASRLAETADPHPKTLAPKPEPSVPGQPSTSAKTAASAKSSTTGQASTSAKDATSTQSPSTSSTEPPSRSGSAPSGRAAGPSAEPAQRSAEPMRPGVAPPAVAAAPAMPSGKAPDETGTGASAKSGAVFVSEIATAKITRGDNLWQISRRSYGSGVRYTVIFDANKDQIRNPNLIYPGQIFVLPKDEDASKRG